MTNQDKPLGGAAPLVLFLVDVFLEIDAGGELGNAAGSNLDDTASLRIAPIAGLALRDGERAEADECDAIALLECGSHGAYEGIDGGGGTGLADAGRGRDFLNQIPFVHDG